MTLDTSEIPHILLKNLNFLNDYENLLPHHIIIKIPKLLDECKFRKFNKYTKCPICFKTFGFGSRYPYILPCPNLTHIICFNCYSDFRLNFCPIDHNPIARNSASPYHIAYQTDVFEYPRCTCGKLFSSLNPPYKLNCLHVMCQKCMDFQHELVMCRNCRLLTVRNEIKISKKILKKIDYVEFNCIAHRRTCARYINKLQYSLENRDIHFKIPILLCEECLGLFKSIDINNILVFKIF